MWRHLVAKFAINASGAMLLPSLVQVSESISGSVVPLAMFVKNLLFISTFESELGFSYTTECFLKSLSEIKDSQMLMKENPRKRPSAPPNSATRDCHG